MKKILVPLAALLLLALAAPVFAEWEAGFSFTPITQDMTGGKGTSSFIDDSLKGFHFGYSFAYILYASWDAIVLPPWLVEGMTTRVEPDPNDPTGMNLVYIPGIPGRPGFLNLIDFGISLGLGPIVLATEMGVNQLYIYKQDELQDFKGDFGANIRLAAGLRFGWWGLTASGTSVFPSFETAVQTVAALFREGEVSKKALATIVGNLIPSLILVIYL